jgi:hypothetical protein
VISQIDWPAAIIPALARIGFLQGNSPLNPEYWLDRRIIHYLKQQLLVENQQAHLQLSSN